MKRTPKRVTRMRDKKLADKLREPDPELVECVAHGIWEKCEGSSFLWDEVDQDAYRDLARAALASADRWRRERMEQCK